MCAICGCDHHHAEHEHHHDHEHHPHHEHHHVDLEARILGRNDILARQNRAWLGARGVLALNLMGAPGCGKTTLLERTIAALGPRNIAVIEGDQATSNDAERVRAAGAAAVQVNTGTGCHLDARMVASSLRQLDPPAGSVVVIENVGNLVCPALFQLGEHRRVVVLSVAEGDDKPLKYPHMFRAADLVVISKVDLAPHVDFDAARAAANARAVNPAADLLQVSAKTGAGLAGWVGWIGAELERLRDGGERRVERPAHALGLER